MSELHTSWEDVLSRHVWRRLWFQGAADFAVLLWSERGALGPSRRTVALFLGFTILLHLALIWLLLRNAALEVSPPEFATGPLQVSIVSTATAVSTPPEPTMQSPVAAPPTPAPEIEMGAPQSDASSADGVPQTLAPRPDPSHPNLSPKILGASSGSRVLLRILVGPSGEVGDAQIVQSCGRPEIDTAAITFVKGNWRFLPAMIGGSAVPFWTTVLVPLSEA